MFSSNVIQGLDHEQNETRPHSYRGEQPQLELLELMKPDTPVGKFVRECGPGLHHICVAVNSIN
jgi:hypothetical protein